jgi:hypothetical protein
MFFVCSVKARRAKTADFAHLGEKLDALERRKRRFLGIVSGKATEPAAPARLLGV